jgi:hypothetical protein
MGPALPKVEPPLLPLAPGPFVPVGVVPTPPLLEDPELLFEKPLNPPLDDPMPLPDEP